MLNTLKEPKSLGFLLVSKPKNNISSNDKEPIPTKIKTLLNKCSDMIISDLPTSLPPLRDINHEINLIPSSSLPNKAPYKMTTSQHEEIVE